MLNLKNKPTFYPAKPNLFGEKNMVLAVFGGVKSRFFCCQFSEQKNTDLAAGVVQVRGNYTTP